MLAPARAQETDRANSDQDIVKLEAMTITADVGRYAETTSAAATKVPVNLIDLAASVKVLNSSFLNDVRAPRLENTFGYVTGLNKQAPNANAFTLRGFSAASGGNLSSLQIDGLPGLSTRFASPPTINVERVEVIKGPTSVLYGQGNPGGMINIISKSPKSVREASVTTYLSTYAGQTSGFGDALSWTAALDTTGPIDAAKHWLYRLVASYEDQNPFRDYGWQRNKYLYPSVTYQWNAQTWLGVKMDYVREARHSDDGLAVPFRNTALLPPINVAYDPPNDRDTDYGESLTAQFHHEFFGRWVLAAAYRATWHGDTRVADEASQGAIVSATPYTDSTIVRRYTNRINSHRYNFFDANVHGDIGPAGFKNTLVFGLNGGREFYEFNLFTQGPNLPPINIYHSVPNVPVTYPAFLPSSRSDRHVDLWNYGVYVSDQIKLGEHWDASLGWRYDKQDAYQFDVFVPGQYKPTESKTLPSAGLVFHPVPIFSLYASYCEGFKPQAPGNVDVNGSPNFPPETSKQVEGGVKIETLDHNLTGSIGCYDIKKKNVLTSTGLNTPTGLSISNLSGLQESKGLELELTYLPLPNWEMQLGYTYIDARVKSSTTVTIVGAMLDNTPHNSGSLWTRYNIPRGALKNLGFGLGAMYASRRHGIITNVPANRLVAQSYTRIDAGIYYKWRRFDYALNVGNVFDRTYISGMLPGDATRITPGEPRKVTFSVSVAL